MKKILYILFIISLSLGFIRCNRERAEIPNLITTDGESFSDKDYAIKHEFHLYKMRTLQMEHEVITGSLSKYRKKILDIDYEMLRGNALSVLESSYNENKLVTLNYYKKDIDTIMSTNGMIFYIPKDDKWMFNKTIIDNRKKYNNTLIELQKLDKEINFKYK